MGVPKLFFLAENQEYIISFEVLLHPVLVFIKVETKFPYSPPPPPAYGAQIV